MERNNIFLVSYEKGVKSSLFYRIIVLVLAEKDNNFVT